MSKRKRMGDCFDAEDFLDDEIDDYDEDEDEIDADLPRDKQGYTVYDDFLSGKFGQDATSLKIKVVGVTYPNKDGTSRQELLKQISTEHEGKAEVSIVEDTFEESPALGIYHENQLIGYILKDYVSWIKEKLEIRKGNICLEVYGGQKGKNYGAVVLFDTESAYTLLSKPKEKAVEVKPTAQYVPTNHSKYFTRNVLILIGIVAVFFVALFIFYASNKDNVGRSRNEIQTNITSFYLSSWYKEVELKAGKTENAYFTVNYKKYEGDFSVDDIEFISENPEIAIFEYDHTTLTTYVYYNIIAVSAGETVVFAKTKDGKVQTDKIKVIVVSDPLSETSEEETVEEPVEVIGEETVEEPIEITEAETEAPEPITEPATITEAPKTELVTISSAPKTEPVTEATQAVDRLVYITETGEKYHKAGCRYLDNSQIAIQLNEAILEGYVACLNCKP